MPLKNRMKTKCVKFNSKCEFVRTCLCGVMFWVFLDDPFAEIVVREDGRVSGRHEYR